MIRLICISSRSNVWPGFERVENVQVQVWLRSSSLSPALETTIEFKTGFETGIATLLTPTRFSEAKTAGHLNPYTRSYKLECEHWSDTSYKATQKNVSRWSFAADGKQNSTCLENPNVLVCFGCFKTEFLKLCLRVDDEALRERLTAERKKVFLALRVWKRERGEW